MEMQMHMNMNVHELGSLSKGIKETNENYLPQQSCYITIIIADSTYNILLLSSVAQCKQLAEHEARHGGSP